VPSSRRRRSTRPALDQWRLEERLRIDRRLAFNRLVVTFGCLLTMGSAAAMPFLLRTQPGLGGPEPVAQLPPDDPDRGLVYGGLAAAKRGAPCAGGYEVAGVPGCTHGPDEPPPGLDVNRTVAPVAPATSTPPLATRTPGSPPAESELLADALRARAPAVPAIVSDAAPPTGAFTSGALGIACDVDGRAGPRVQVLYVYEAGTSSRYDQYLASFRIWAAGADAIVDGRDGADPVGGTARTSVGPRQLRFVTAGRCEIDVSEVELRSGALSTFADTIDALTKLGFGRSDRAYMVFADATVYCGISTVPHGEGADIGPLFGRIDSGCWHPLVAARQFARNLGATSDNSGGGDMALPTGLADSPFLVGGDAGDAGAAATPAASEPSAAPSKADQSTAAGALRISDVTATTARVSWEPASAGATYTVHLAGRPLGQVRVTAVRIVGLRPETAYQLEIQPAGAPPSHSATVDFQTAPAVLPAPGALLTLTNALTADAAEVFGARTANGTPVVLAPRHDGAQQRWQLQMVGPGAYQLRSVSSGGCLAPAERTAGAVLVVRPCDAAEADQRWRLAPTAYGFHVTTDDAGLVLGVGAATYRGLRVLVLQAPGQHRYHSWTT
jgi:Ricin-type beta-trefoil lectin domain